MIRPGCPDCELTTGGCAAHAVTYYPQGPAANPSVPIAPFFALTPQLPLVCPGSQTPAIDWIGAGTPSTIDKGECGICHQRVGLDANGRCVTHPYQPARGVEVDHG